MKFGKRFISLVLALVMIFSLTTGASAASAQNIKVQLSPNITVTYNGKVQSMKDAAGNPVYPLLNGGTTYLPVRAVANMLGVAVEWDGATSTVLLADPPGGRKPAGSTGDVGKKPAPSTITVQLSPGVSVNYNGKAQTMADVNGNPVYPLMYSGTTYLPVRAVANMLGVPVDWNGSTQTVILGNATPFDAKGAVISSNSRGFSIALRYEELTEENLRAALVEAKATEEEIALCVNSLKRDINNSYYKGHALKYSYDRTPFTNQYGTYEGTFSVEIATNLEVNTENKATVDKFTTSDDAENLGTNHIGFDYAEIDWSTVSNGYVRVRLNKEMSYFTRCTVRAFDTNYNMNFVRYTLPLGKWYNIPVQDGYTYLFSVQPTYYDKDFKLPNDEWELISRPDLNLKLQASVKDKNAELTISTGRIDYENAPETCAKALELTENCKTDAEKVKVIYDWVSKNIKYDYKLYNELEDYNAKCDAGELNPQYDLFRNGSRQNLNLDSILSSKSGVCEDFATLTVGMLRSLGIPCKYVGGYVNSKDGWALHGWVAVSPSVAGLNANTLHGWKDENGWVNIDPTNASNTSFTSNAANYKANSEY